MKNKLLYSLAATSLAFSLNAQNVNIPDANFKTYLIGNQNINTNNDTEIQLSEAQAYQGSLSLGNRSISDLTGIEAFTNIVNLQCYGNNLTSLNLSANTALTTLDCSGNSLTNLIISSSTNLQDLLCQRNLLTSLNLSANTQLTRLNCYDNQLTSLNLNNNLVLNDLDVSQNLITTLDLSNNTALTKLYASENELTILDLRQNTALFRLTCADNQLTRLYLNNGNNSNFDLFWAANNPNLTCIQVDDATYSTTTWVNGAINSEDPFLYDSGVTFSEDCNYTASITESLFEVNALKVSPNPTENNLTISSTINTIVSIVNLLGEELMQVELKAGQNHIETENFVPGVYLIQTAKGKAIKFVKI